MRKRTVEATASDDGRNDDGTDTNARRKSRAERYRRRCGDAVTMLLPDLRGEVNRSLPSERRVEECDWLSKLL